MIASNKEKEKWVNASVTLNGKPAKIVGKKITFPKVVEINGPLSVEFSWQAVKRIMTKNNGEFKAD